MTQVTGQGPGEASIAEIQEFAAFSARTQRYIRRSLDIGLRRYDAAERWSRDVLEESSIRAQVQIYERLDVIRTYVPKDNQMDTLELFLAPLMVVSTFDLAQGRINDFAGYRFLYERLIGAAVRPWLAMGYAAAASMPHLPPERRRQLLRSLDRNALAANWSAQEPSFYPQWVDKVDEIRPAR